LSPLRRAAGASSAAAGGVVDSGAHWSAASGAASICSRTEFLVNFFPRQEKRDLRGDYHVRRQPGRESELIKMPRRGREIKLFGPAASPENVSVCFGILRALDGVLFTSH
jgi:hypothetical protein